MEVEALEKNIKKQCKIKRVSVFDLFGGYEKENETDVDVLVDTFSMSRTKCNKIVAYLSSIGLKTEIGTSEEFACYDNEYCIHAFN